MTTAERVKRWRKRTGLNLMKAAAECGLAQSTVWKVEKGYRVGVHVAQRLAPVLRVRWERLVMGDQADGVRPSAGWLVREDVVRGAVERIKSQRDRIKAMAEERLLEQSRTSEGLDAAGGKLFEEIGKRNLAEKEAQQAREALAKSEMEAAELLEEKQIADEACDKAVALMSEAMTKASKAEAEVKLLREQVEALTAERDAARDMLGVCDVEFSIRHLALTGDTADEMRRIYARDVTTMAELREQVEALTAQLQAEEAAVKRLREVILGAPRISMSAMGDVSAYPRSLQKGTYSMVRLSPDGTELAEEKEADK